MKKALLGLSGVIILTAVVVLFINAKNSPQEPKKAATEQKADCGKCPSSSAACGTMAEAQKAVAAKCDPAKCKEMGCDPAKCKEGKCDPATCKANCKTGSEMKKCDPSGCTGMAKK